MPTIYRTSECAGSYYKYITLFIYFFLNLVWNTKCFLLFFERKRQNFINERVNRVF